jgi:Peptidase_C39 like family
MQSLLVSGTPQPYLSKDETDDFATRQVMSLVRRGEGAPPSKRNWSLDLLPEGGSFNWDNLNLYDVSHRLLFRDKIIKLDANTRIRLRTAASNLLRVPVWSASATSSFDAQASLAKATDVATQSGLVPIEGEEALVCYSYPKLGLLCNMPGADYQSIVDLGNFQIIDVRTASQVTSPEMITCWSPYDVVGPATIGAFRATWEGAMTALPAGPTSPAGVLPAVEIAQQNLEEQTVELNLHVQETSYYCAVATAQMILEYNGIKKTQSEIAAAMRAQPPGVDNQPQIDGYKTLSAGQLDALIETRPTFEGAKNEIAAARLPMKSGIYGHARACAGFRNDGQPWLYIYDPWPGSGIYWENWDGPQIHHTNFIYVRQVLYS